MDERRIELLLHYLKTLSDLNQNGHYCNEEIKSCTKEIEQELYRVPTEGEKTSGPYVTISDDKITLSADHIKVQTKRH